MAEDDAEDVSIDTILTYCGFQEEDERENIALDGFEDFDDIMALTKKDIGDLAKGFAERTAANGKIVF